MLIFGMALVFFAKMLRPALAAIIETIPAASAYDFILDVLPVISASWIIYIYIYLMTAASILLIVTKFYYKPIDLPYVAFVFAFAMILTDILFTVTVVGPPLNFTNTWLAWDFNKDLFPSMHVGAPFIAFLLADRRWVKAILLAVTAIMVAVVLLMHTHYTIDAIGAIFIFFGLWCLCDKYLKNFLRRAYFARR